MFAKILKGARFGYAKFETNYTWVENNQMFPLI